MAVKKESITRETRSTKNDAIATVMTEGIDTIVKHNKHLIALDAHKDSVLMQFVEQAQQERLQFARIQTMMVEKFSEMIDSIQKLKDKEYEREEKREEAKFMRGLKERGYTDLRQIATIGLNQFAGRTMIKESERGLLAEFLESLDDEQIQDMAGKLRPAQMVAFSKLVNALKEQEEKENNETPGKETDDARH